MYLDVKKKSVLYISKMSWKFGWKKNKTEISYDFLSQPF